MNGFQVDPDALTAAAAVVARQDAHLQRVDDYISSACSSFGAFSGVLELFQGSCESAVATAHRGVADSRAVADRLETALVESRKDYLDTDREVYEWFRAKFGDLVAFPPYDAPGSGNTTPGGPHRDAPLVVGTAPKPDDPLPKVPAVLDKAIKDVFPTDPNPTPWLDPKDALKDHAVRLPDRLSDEYRYYRTMGYDHAEAMELAQNDNGRSVTVEEETRTYDVMEQRKKAEFDRAYTEAIVDGKTDAEARRAGNDAAAAQAAVDSADRGRRTDISGAAGDAHGLYSEVMKAAERGEKLVGHVDDLADTGKDLDEYDDYERRDEDRSAQEWAGR